MSKPISRLWLLGPPAAIVLSLLVYYAKFQSVRRWVDTRFPWVEENIGSHLSSFTDGSRGSTAPHRTAASSAITAPSEPNLEPARPISARGVPSFFALDGTLDLKKLAADRGAWPQTVILRKAMAFPAVVNGKVVGKVEVPTGTEAKLVSIKDGKLGVEYRGGGAWLAVDETDIAQRLRD